MRKIYTPPSFLIAPEKRRYMSRKRTIVETKIVVRVASVTSVAGVTIMAIMARMASGWRNWRNYHG